MTHPLKTRTGTSPSPPECTPHTGAPSLAPSARGHVPLSPCKDCLRTALELITEKATL